jgi:GNAT superfamily N-acetyltransferase
MAEEYRIIQIEQPGQAEWGTIGGGIHHYNIEQAGEDDHRSICFVLHGAQDEIVGGVIGATHWEWFHLDLMWLKEEVRGQGYGHRLLTMAEQEARKNGAKNVYLDTFSFQALDFYQEHGYRVFGELEDFPPGHQRYYLRKEL